MFYDQALTPGTGPNGEPVMFTDGSMTKYYPIPNGPKPGGPMPPPQPFAGVGPRPGSPDGWYGGPPNGGDWGPAGQRPGYYGHDGLNYTPIPGEEAARLRGGRNPVPVPAGNQQLNFQALANILRQYGLA